MNTDLKILGDEIKKTRKEKGMSLRDLAKHTDVSHVTINNLENGKCEPLISTVINITTYLDISLDILLSSLDTDKE